ncbi:hypothetical protein IW140_005953 [Coemansia sp. RSA 1813]|nr:hypothetical protein EV178_005974 [Coemansia sp. RSA 1646]KAJ1765739.1 hypothetical protein LPJ74_006229 [Coemansia sp. RSA 1843]KAJ2086101.1 hypothetical protein IW138_005921 [Coemansia sp. RSA 986]KAJ2211011.1 hypothetical protein EV179_005817 [Coemansia sp. RSA 487]KAJ2563865.1 hypothetical protein IW140_005953 [Coemansia sp. RSA 1813]
MRPHRQPPPLFPSLEANDNSSEGARGFDNSRLYQTPDTYAHRGDVEMMSVESGQGTTGGPRLGGHYTGEYTPPSHVAAGAVGRRLDLTMPPRFALAREEAGPSGIAESQQPDGIDAYYAPLTRKQQQQRLPSSPDGLDDPVYQESSFPTPVGGLANVQQEEIQVDQDFVLSLRQEGELETLTRKAMKDAREAWKQITMDYLHKQVAGLEQDEWMYS